MLTEERFKLILDILKEKKSITVSELVEELKISESTVRRDLTSLSKMGKLNKVHGGATFLEEDYNNEELDVKIKHTLNVDEKKRIGKFAASLIEEGDFIYIDAGTSTELMIDYINEKKAIYVMELYMQKSLFKKDWKLLF